MGPCPISASIRHNMPKQRYATPYHLVPRQRPSFEISLNQANSALKVNVPRPCPVAARLAIYSARYERLLWSRGVVEYL